MRNLFHSKFTDKVRGAAIINHKKVLFEPANVILDTDGHYVIVSRMLQNTPVALISVYAPTLDDDAFFFLFCFFTRLFANADSHCIIMGGDFNLVQTKLSKSAKVVKIYTSQLGISDAWRYKKTQGRAFSFFSHVHHTFSRIDFFLFNNYFIDCMNVYRVG